MLLIMEIVCCGLGLWSASKAVLLIGIVLMSIRILLTILMMKKIRILNQIKFLLLSFKAVPVYIFFYLSRQRHRCYNFQYFRHYIEIFWKKYSLALHL
jgi:hypothetical protein